MCLCQLRTWLLPRALPVRGRRRGANTSSAIGSSTASIITLSHQAVTAPAELLDVGMHPGLDIQPHPARVREHEARPRDRTVGPPSALSRRSLCFDRSSSAQHEQRGVHDEVGRSDFGCATPAGRAPLP